MIHKTWLKPTVRLQPGTLLLRVAVTVLPNSECSPVEMMIVVQSSGPVGGLVLLRKFRSFSDLSSGPHVVSPQSTQIIYGQIQAGMLSTSPRAGNFRVE